MSRCWTSEYHPLFRDRYLKLERIFLRGDVDEVLGDLAELDGDYSESLRRLEEAYWRKRVWRWRFIFLGIGLPVFWLWGILSGVLEVFGGGIFFFVVSVGVSYYVFYRYLPGFCWVEGFYREFRGVGKRLSFVMELLRGYRLEIGSQVELELELRGIVVEEEEFLEALGEGDGSYTFVGDWCRLSFEVEGGRRYRYLFRKLVSVEQRRLEGRDGRRFCLRRYISLYEGLVVEVELDERRYRGILQFRDRDWEAGGGRLEVSRIRAGSHSLGLEAGYFVFRGLRCDRFARILGEVNGVCLEGEEVLGLMRFLESHFLEVV